MSYSHFYPTKHTDRDRTVLWLGGLTLEYLKANKGGASNADMHAYLIEQVGEKVRFCIDISLCFLFAVGLIDYQITNDSLLITLKSCATRSN